MKKLLMTLGAATLTAFTFNAVASDALLSPRGGTVQIKHVAGVNNDVNLVNTTAITVVPRALGDQSRAAGVNNEINPVAGCRNMTASPKLIQACAATPGMPGCKAEVADAKP
jgi:hypothetical protein